MNEHINANTVYKSRGNLILPFLGHSTYFFNIKLDPHNYDNKVSP